MTDLDSPKKNNDCYFYYYSTCSKGDSCTFRHEPSALGCETMCSFWKEGKCLNVQCNFRHMELRKNRKVIPCYWESQPVGCLKAHCPFLHQNPRPSDVSPEKLNTPAENSQSKSVLQDQLNQSNERKVTAVDSLVVNFEEESDNESTPSYSPAKNGGRIVKVKTLEEIKLEKIQAESAAYYSCYEEDADLQQPTTTVGDDLRQRIVSRIMSKSFMPQRTVNFRANRNDRVSLNKRLSNDQLAYILGDDSLRKKRKLIHQEGDVNFQVTFDQRQAENEEFPVDKFINSENRRQVIVPNRTDRSVVENIRIKTLAEIRAEKQANNKHFTNTEMPAFSSEEAEVSSTSADENMQENKFVEKGSDLNPTRKIKLRRKLLVSDENVVSSNRKVESTPMDTKESLDPIEWENRILEDEDDLNTTSETVQNTPKGIDQENTGKIMDEGLLLEDDDDELLKEIDSLLEN